ncbi:hypothetical protein BGZ47_010270 [Haplosporangium gracile]|nr:hypothetical protein BGZ47_010270 [Haplosporangium gracile]
MDTLREKLNSLTQAVDAQKNRAQAAEAKVMEKNRTIIMLAHKGDEVRSALDRRDDHNRTIKDMTEKYNIVKTQLDESLLKVSKALAD